MTLELYRFLLSFQNLYGVRYPSLAVAKLVAPNVRYKSHGRTCHIE